MEQAASTLGVVCNESIRSLLRQGEMSAGRGILALYPARECPPQSDLLSLPKPAFWGTHWDRREARQPYMDGVYMLPLREERSREGLVFWLKMSWLAAWNAFSTSLLV